MQSNESVILHHNSTIQFMDTLCTCSGAKINWEIFCRCSLLNFDIIQRLFLNLH